MYMYAKAINPVPAICNIYKLHVDSLDLNDLWDNNDIRNSQDRWMP